MKREIHGIPLKCEPRETDKRMDVVMDSKPAENSKDKVDDIDVHLWKSPGVHWYII